MKNPASLPLALVALAAALTSQPALAQGVDLVEQHIVVDVRGDDLHVTLTAQAVSSDDAEIFAFLEPGMDVVSATLDGEPLTVTPYPNYEGYISYVEFPALIPTGEGFELALELAGTPDCASASSAGFMRCVVGANRTVLTPPQPGAAWYLMNLFDSDPFTGSIEVIAPDAFEVVAGHGAPTLVEAAEGGGQRWRFALSIPTETLGVFAGEVVTVESSQGFPVRGLLEDEEGAATLQGAVELASELIPLYGEMFGVMPVDQATASIVPATMEFGGMGLLGNVFLGAFILDDSFAFMVEQGVAHEFAHTWWGGTGSAAYVNEARWLQEGFAEYSAWRGLGTVYDDDMRTSGARMNAVWYLFTRPGSADGAITGDGVLNESPAAIHIAYHKGSVIVRTLEEQIGLEAMDEVLTRFNARGAGGLSLENLLEDVETVTGQRAESWADSWVRQPGFPTLTVGSELSSADDGTTTVSLFVGVDGDFDWEAPVRAVLDDGSVEVRTVALHQGPQNVELSFARPPLSVTVDPRWTAVRLVEPVVSGDVNLDGEVDGLDLLEVAVHQGTGLPAERRRDGAFDPLYDVDGDKDVDALDVQAILEAPLG